MAVGKRKQDPWRTSDGARPRLGLSARFSETARPIASAGKFIVSRNNTGLVVAIVAAWLVFTVFGQGFNRQFSFFSISQLVAGHAVVGYANAVALVTGRMNLAVGAIGAMVAMTVGWLLTETQVSLPVAIVLGLLLGMLAGLLLGWLTLVTRLNSLIVTVAMMSVYTGLVLRFSGGTPIPRVGGRRFPAALPRWGLDDLFVPVLSALIVPTLVVAIVLWYLYRQTSLGRQMLAVGANERVAALSGVRVSRVVLSTFALSGLLCGVAGVMETARFGAALPNLGADWLLPAFIIPVIGGTHLRGGTVSISGTLLGAVFLMSMNQGLVALDISTFWLPFYQGLVLVVVVVANERGRELIRRGLRRRPLAADPGVG